MGIRETKTQPWMVDIAVTAVLILLSPSSDSIYDRAGDAAFNMFLVKSLTKVLKKEDQSQTGGFIALSTAPPGEGWQGQAASTFYARDFIVDSRAQCKTVGKTSKTNVRHFNPTRQSQHKLSSAPAASINGMRLTSTKCKTKSKKCKTDRMRLGGHIDISPFTPPQPLQRSSLSEPLVAASLRFPYMSNTMSDHLIQTTHSG